MSDASHKKHADKGQVVVDKKPDDADAARKDDISAKELPMHVDIGIGKHELDTILYSAWKAGAADIFFASGEPVVARIKGERGPITKRALQSNEVASISKLIYGENATSILGSGHALDPRYGFQIGRGRRIGFRVNMTQCLAGKTDGAIQITCRALPGLPARLDKFDVPLQICKAMFSRQGLVIVAGETGSGKSTLLAAFFRYLLEVARNHNLLTYEHPIEYTYGEVEKHFSNAVYQQEIVKDVETFAVGVSNALRRAPTDVLIGEARDRETISGVIEAVLTGAKTYTTVHARTPGGVINRMVQSFPPVDHSSMTEKLIAETTLIVVQRLVKRIDGGQCAINSWFINDRESKDILAKVKSDEIGKSIDALCLAKKTTFEHHAAYRVMRGEISVDASSYACGVPPLLIQDIVDNTAEDDWLMYDKGDFSSFAI